MIAFIILTENNLVPLIEGLCSSNSCVFEFFVLRSHLLLFFFGRKNMLKEKKQLVQNLIPPPSIYVYMCTSYTYTDIFILSFSPSGFLPCSRNVPSRPFGSHPEYPDAVSVCVCASTHIHLHTRQPPSKNRENTDNTPIFLM